MAVLVRSGRTSIPALRRSLRAAGVPVEVASDETPLVARAGRAAAARRPPPGGRPRHRRPRRPRRDRRRPRRGAADLPAGRASTPRRSAALARALRSRDDAVPLPASWYAVRSPSRASSTACAASRPSGPGGVVGPASAPPATGSTPATAPSRCSGRSGTAPAGAAGCATRPSSVASRPGSPTATSTRSVRLFDAAARSEEQAGHVGLREFLDTLSAQEIPADTLAERGVRGDAVRLLTAHRSKGLEWRPRRRRPRAGGRLARPPAPRHAAAAPTGSAATGWSRRSPRAALLAEERRLFYVAATRARDGWS